MTFAGPFCVTIAPAVTLSFSRRERQVAWVNASAGGSGGLLRTAGPGRAEGESGRAERGETRRAQFIVPTSPRGRALWPQARRRDFRCRRAVMRKESYPAYRYA